MYMLNVQVTAYGRQTIPDRRVFGAPIISLKRLKLKSSNSVHG